MHSLIPESGFSMELSEFARPSKIGSSSFSLFLFVKHARMEPFKRFDLTLFFLKTNLYTYDISIKGVPVAFAFMKSKNEASYTEFFNRMNNFFNKKPKATFFGTGFDI